MEELRQIISDLQKEVSDLRSRLDKLEGKASSPPLFSGLEMKPSVGRGDGSLTPVKSIYKARNITVRIDHIAHHCAVRVDDVRRVCRDLNISILKERRGRYAVLSDEAIKISWYFKTR